MVCLGKNSCARQGIFDVRYSRVKQNAFSRHRYCICRFLRLCYVYEEDIRMENTTIPDYPRGVTFEQVWASLQDLAASQKETDRLIKENAERQKETDRIVKRNARQMGGLHNRFGEMAEHLVKPGIFKRFNELGYHFDAVSRGGQEIRGEDGKIKAEIDLLLENGETVMAVEVKATVKMKHIEEHIKRLEILRDSRRKKHDLRQVEGAIAGAIFGAEEKKAVIEAGFYVIMQSGDTMKIEVPEGFVPRRW